jgi:uncharacterized protein
MSRGFFDPGFDGLPTVLPIFPLPGVLLLPGGHLPLNIFEPRYVAMVRDALGGERLIGMIQPNEPGGDRGAAKVYATGCAGRITAFSETGDGRYLITLSGLIRFEVERELPLLSGYRRAVPDFSRYRNDLEADTGPFDREGFLETLGAYLEVAEIEGDWNAIEDTDNEHLVTSLAMICPFAPPEKQALLEAMTLPERAETLTAIMVMATHEKQKDGPCH